MRDRLNKLLARVKWDKLDRRVKALAAALVTALVLITLLAVVLVVIRAAGRDEPYYAGAVVEIPQLHAPVPPPPPEEPPPEEPYEPYEECPGPVSVLTGLPIHGEYAARRPLAVVINNIRRALPQSGITAADIIYEVLSEGDVTRIIGIFQSYIPYKIGPVRSARDYFVDFAFNHDAVFIFHGASPSGYRRIRGLAIAALDGMELEGRVFWRDRTYPDWARNTGTRPLEHSSFTGRERIAAHFEARGIRGYMAAGDYGFSFAPTPAEAESLGPANRVTVPFSANYTRTFVFDPYYGHYLVENRDGPHLDAETMGQAAVSNILIQLTPMNIIAGDEAGRRDVQTLGEGTGYLAVNGEFFAARWVKDDHTAPTRWYFQCGAPLTLTPGRTWVCVFQAGGTALFE